MQDGPSPLVILDLAIAQLSAGDAGESGRAKFETRLASAALQLVRRAIDLSPIADADERARLAALLQRDGDLEDLNRDLCARIRSGALSLSSPGLAAHVRAATMAKLAIDQPTYAAYRRALEKTEG